ncbi:type VII secretion protein EccCa [Gordonia phosphorivorans]|uniref:Type VII secretion protein EccCa n=1 Tax=Gordonia phosphorivorans TaxID=1056982 RepID=A0ABV6H7S7_9ACTN
MGTTVAFVRPRRLTQPVAPGGELVLTGPPEVARGAPQSLLVRLLPLVMVVALVGMVALMVMTGGRGALSNPLFLMFPLMMVMSMVGMLAGGGRGGPPRSAELNEDRKDYLRYLAQTRAGVGATVREQRIAAAWSHPDPAALPALLGSVRMWERRPGDADFLQIRLGVGTQPLATALVPPEVAPAEDLEPVCALALRRFVQTHATVPGLPSAVSLRSFPAVGFEGPRAEVLGCVRSMLAAVALLHGPDHVLVAVAAEDPRAPDWDWVKWLPHAAHPTVRDRVGAARMIYDSLELLETDLADDLAQRGRFSRSAPPVGARPHLIVVLDGGPRTGDEELVIGAGREGLTVLDLRPDGESLAVRRGLRLVVEGGGVAAHTVAGLERFATADSLSAERVEVLARGLARYRPASTLPLPGLDTAQVATDPGLPALLGIPDATAFDPLRGWRGRTPQQRLRVPIGYTAEGTPVDLDLKESAHGGMGPHGLCIGATGSGKSEFLRTLVLALIATHSPDELNLVLVDFKGGATFLGLNTRHVAAVITNLEQELAMVDRMADALSGELNRRQELLRAAGNFANVGEYERAREAGAALAPLPALFIVVDEFSELLAQKPEFAELFVAIGRLGRSLHIHLLLASQRLDEGRLRGLDSHLSYRIGLKTFSANESRTVLGVPDAYHLPSTPGAAYLKCDSGAPVRFSTSFVSGPYLPPHSGPVGADGLPRASGEVLRFTAERVPLPEFDDVEEVQAPTGTSSLLDTLVGRAAGHGSLPHAVWLPPLESAVTLDAFVAGHAAIGDLRIPMGVVDRPYDQRRETLWLDLSGAAGNAAVVGGPQAGKSTALRTLICAAAATHTPQQVSFYCLDFGGGTLAALAGLPHVAGVATKSRRDAVRRTLAEVRAILAAREELFATEGLESMREYRAARHAGRFAEDPHGDVFLVIDGLTTLRSDFETVEDDVNTLVGQGLSFGVHVIVASARWADIRPAMKDLLGTRLELRLGDPLDSEMGRKVAATVPTGRPGRGLTGEELHFLVALPRADGRAEVESLPEGTAAFVAETAGVYADCPAPRVRLLADDIDLASITESMAAHGDSAREGKPVLGLRESDLAPVVMDFAAEPHLLVFGDVESGKTQTLRTLVTGLVAGGGPEVCKLVLVDYRRTLLGAVAGEHLAGYASSAQTAAPMMAALADYLRARLPGEDVTADQLACGDWWSGPVVYLVIDDYDLVATAMGNPLTPLVELLGHARDIGLRVILARRSGGIGRGLFDPLVAGLRDLSCDVLLLSGDPDEGYIVGRHRMQKLGAGRGELISRARRADMVQVAR